MHTGTQLHAPEGFDGPAQKTRLTTSCAAIPIVKRVLLIEFRHVPRTIKRSTSLPLQNLQRQWLPHQMDLLKPPSPPQLPNWAPLKPVLTFPGTTSVLRKPWTPRRSFLVKYRRNCRHGFLGMNIEELHLYSAPRIGRKISHGERIDKLLAHLWPLIQNLDQVLAAELPETLINAHARACNPPQNERACVQRSMLTFVLASVDGYWHYKVFNIGRWDRMGRNRKIWAPFPAKRRRPRIRHQ